MVLESPPNPIWKLRSGPPSRSTIDPAFLNWTPLRWERDKVQLECWFVSWSVPIPSNNLLAAFEDTHLESLTSQAKSSRNWHFPSMCKSDLISCTYSSNTSFLVQEDGAHCWCGISDATKEGGEGGRGEGERGGERVLSCWLLSIIQLLFFIVLELPFFPSS